jgi:hypothetical protein
MLLDGLPFLINSALHRTPLRKKWNSVPVVDPSYIKPPLKYFNPIELNSRLYFHIVIILITLFFLA